MPERVDHHVRLFFVRPPGERDTWDAMPMEVKTTWRNALLGPDQLDAPGERGHYFVALTNEERRAFEAASNCEYAVPAEEVHTHDVGETEMVAEDPAIVLESHGEPVEPNDFAFPEPDTLAYHGAKGTEKNARAGRGFLVFLLDTGVSKTIEDMTPGGVVFRKNYVGTSGTHDVQGHGSMTCSLAVPNGAALAVCKVLGDDGSGSSVGITAAIRDAAKFVRENPKYKGKTILSGSLGGRPGAVFQPYVDACTEAEEAGVLCLWSAGNDGVHGLSAPSNWRDDRASIAFHRPTDSRASFSNHSADAGLATEGQSVLVIDKMGRLVRASGTSFSLPLWTRHIIVGAWIRSASVFLMHRTTLVTARDTSEPVQEEAHGVLRLWRAINKLRK